MKKWLFLRWALIVSVTFVGAAFAVSLGGIGYVKANDATNLSFVIMALFAAMTLYCGALTFKTGEDVNLFKGSSSGLRNRLREIESSVDYGWFAVDLCEKIGLLGTIIGLILSLKGFQSFRGTDQQAIQGLIAQLSIGLSTAFITTLVGIICSILLSLQYQNLCNAIDKTLLHVREKNENGGGAE